LTVYRKIEICLPEICCSVIL